MAWSSLQEQRLRKPILFAPTTCGNAPGALGWGTYGVEPLTCSSTRATTCGRHSLVTLQALELIEYLF
jgi:hypothetical protein